MDTTPADTTNVKNAFTQALLALILLVPVPSLSVAIGMGVLMPPGPVAQVIFIIAKVWLLGLPLAWLILVDKQKPKFPPIKKPGLVPELVIGILTLITIFAAYFIVGKNWIDPQLVKDTSTKTGLDDPTIYIVAAVYYCLVNSLLEEYVWRWFVFSKSEAVLARFFGSAGKYAAIFASALFFTLHHIVALKVQFHWNTTILASLGVFIGGSIWSSFYLKYRSIWPGYIAHVFADIPIFIIGYWLIFK